MKNISPENLIRKCAKGGYKISDQEAARISNYLGYLLYWSKKINLIGPGAKIRIWEDHLSECLWLNSLMKDESPICDFGSGAGFPGIILACLNSQREVHLYERKKRKASFLSYVVNNIPLKNAKVICEDNSKKFKWKEEQYPIIVTRAVSRVDEIIKTVNELGREGCLLYALIGKNDLDNIDGIKLKVNDYGWKMEEIIKTINHGKNKGVIVLRK